jgi:hypothetical protein
MADYKRKMGIEEDKDSEAYYRERFNRQTSKPSKYDSIRPAGEEARLSKRKSEGLKQAAMGAALAPAVVALETAMGGSDSKDKGPIGAGATHLARTGDRFAKSVKEAKDFIGSGVGQYKSGKAAEADLDRELESQTKRESRGMAKGGKAKTKEMAKGGMTAKGWGKARGARAAKVY